MKAEPKKIKLKATYVKPDVANLQEEILRLQMKLKNNEQIAKSNTESFVSQLESLKDHH